MPMTPEVPGGGAAAGSVGTGASASPNVFSAVDSPAPAAAASPEAQALPERLPQVPTAWAAFPSRSPEAEVVAPAFATTIPATHAAPRWLLNGVMKGTVAARANVVPEEQAVPAPVTIVRDASVVAPSAFLPSADVGTCAAGSSRARYSFLLGLGEPSSDG